VWPAGLLIEFTGSGRSTGSLQDRWLKRSNEQITEWRPSFGRQAEQEILELRYLFFSHDPAQEHRAGPVNPPRMAFFR